MSRVPALLESLMRQSQLSQAELSETSKIHRSNLCRFFSGEVDLRLSSLLSLLKALNIDLELHLERELRQRESKDRSEYRSPGEALQSVLEGSDRIVATTFLDSLVSQSRRAPSRIRPALDFLKEYRARLRHQGGAQ